MQTININFTKNDRDLLAWVNMLRDKKLSPATWIQAILLSEALGLDIDAGGVWVSEINARPRPGPLMFGDDRASNNANSNSSSPNKVFGPGNRLVIRVTRPIMLALLRDTAKKRSKIGPYTKAVLRKHIRKLPSAPNQPPQDSQIQDIFALYEDKFTLDRKRTAPPEIRHPQPSKKQPPKNPVPTLAPVSPPPPGKKEDSPSGKRRNPLLSQVF